MDMIEKSIDCMGEDFSSVISAWTVAQVQYLFNRLSQRKFYYTEIMY